MYMEINKISINEILLVKLYNYGIRGVPDKLFSSYLQNRNQCTRYVSTNSDLQPIICGVPQGSLRGPLLFILYINDIHLTSNLFSFILYADDTNILYSNKDLRLLYKTANEHLLKVYEWFMANKLSVNSANCNYMIFHNSPKVIDNDSIDITLNNEILTTVEFTKFLGVYIDERLL